MQSWIESANLTGSQFPIQNLPYGVFRSAALRIYMHMHPLATFSGR